jgi:hypothetical protein
VDARKATLAELERRRTDCIALAEKEADPTMKAALLPRGPGGGRLKNQISKAGRDVAEAIDMRRITL